jgi:predicted NBD/HSP70 family sugar kinase
MMTQRAVLEWLFRAGSGTRAGLADATGISKMTSGAIIQELLDASVVEETMLSGGGKPGRPGRSVTLEGRTPRFLIIEVGVTHTDVTAVPLHPRSQERWATRFATPSSEDAWVSELAAAVLRLSTATQSLWASVVSLPGMLDEAKAQVLLSPNLHWTESAHLGVRVPQTLGIPGCFVQEHRAQALGHIAATSDRDFLLVDSEDGVGAAVVMDGQVLHGALASAGEIGHTTVIGNPRMCGCGGRGCLETLISRPALLAAFGEEMRTAGPTWEQLVNQVAALTEPPQWLVERLDAAAMVIGGSLNTSGLGRVVITGALAELPPPVLTAMTKRIHAASLSGRLGQVTVVCAPRRRALGMLQAVFSRELTATADWKHPCRHGELDVPRLAALRS